MSDREQAHAELRRRGYTDDIHATETCLVTLFFWLTGFLALLTTVA